MPGAIVGTGGRGALGASVGVCVAETTGAGATTEPDGVGLADGVPDRGRPADDVPGVGLAEGAPVGVVAGLVGGVAEGLAAGGVAEWLAAGGVAEWLAAGGVTGIEVDGRTDGVAAAVAPGAPDGVVEGIPDGVADGVPDGAGVVPAPW